MVRNVQCVCVYICVYSVYPMSSVIQIFLNQGSLVELFGGKEVERDVCEGEVMKALAF